MSDLDIATRIRIVASEWIEQAAGYERSSKAAKACGDHAERRRCDLAASWLRACADDVLRALEPGAFIAGSGRRVP